MYSCFAYLILYILVLCVVMFVYNVLVNMMKWVRVKVCNSQAHCILLLKVERNHMFLAFKKKDDVLLDSW